MKQKKETSNDTWNKTKKIIKKIKMFCSSWVCVGEKKLLCKAKETGCGECFKKLHCRAAKKQKRVF